jgi:drug/metabolite transporter (DMT)-like permease
MTWFLLSLVTALAVASCDTGVKKWFSHLTPYEMTLLPLLYGLPPIAVALFLVETPALDRAFYVLFAVSIPLTMVPMVLYMKAIKISPMSLTVPYLAFTPVFIIGTGYLFLGEQVDKWGMAGIVTVCAGGYVLNISDQDRSVLDPLLAVFKETGSWLMLIVSFIFSLSSVIGKMAIMHSSPLFFQTSFFVVLTLVMALVFSLFRKIHLGSFLKHPLKGGLVGLLMAVHIFCHGLAISMTKAAYMMSIKRLSIVFGVIYGGVVFKEENIRTRLAGALLMFSGAALILLKAA